MGDLPPGPQPSAADHVAHSPSLEVVSSSATSSAPCKSSVDNSTPFYSQLSALPQSHLGHGQDFRLPIQLHHHNQDFSVSSLNMGSMAGALPDYGSRETAPPTANPQAVSRTVSGASPSAVAYQLGQNLQMSGHGSANLSSQSRYGTSFASNSFQQNIMPPQSPQHGNYASFGANQPRLAGPTSYQNYPQGSHFVYYPSPYGPQGQFASGFNTQGVPAQALYGTRSSMSNTTFGGQVPIVDYPQIEGGFTGIRMNQGNFHGGDLGSTGSTMHAPLVQAPGVPHSGTISSIPRGPPRKPKQSGHALWVGNLPPGTTIIDLKDHFSRDATKDIESLFLISKSNCAFVNYRTEESCSAAMHRFHDSRFNGARLVCRPRRSSTAASGVPTGPSAMMGSQPQSISRPVTPRQDSVTEGLQEVGSVPPLRESSVDLRSSVNTTNKYFIVKSLTLQDLELSVRNGIWATQTHNENVLNQAFRSAENVYLIFSANKSGEYFGYGRMASLISDDGSRIMSTIPKTENVIDAPDVPKSIPTLATEWAPKGRIIDDSARGTIFWEAESSDFDTDEYNEEKDKSALTVQAETSTMAQGWGKPFQIKWISTNRLPFYRTRGLRNSWNANREVKIARDGTELEPSVGERLIQMFHRLGPSASGVRTLPPLNGTGLSAMQPL